MQWRHLPAEETVANVRPALIKAVLPCSCSSSEAVLQASIPCCFPSAGKVHGPTESWAWAGAAAPFFWPYAVQEGAVPLPQGRAGLLPALIAACIAAVPPCAAVPFVFLMGRVIFCDKGRASRQQKQKLLSFLTSPSRKIFQIWLSGGWNQCGR